MAVLVRPATILVSRIRKAAKLHERLMGQFDNPVSRRPINVGVATITKRVEGQSLSSGSSGA